MITTKSKVTVSFSTSPGDFGYDGLKTEWKRSGYTSSPRKVLDRIEQYRKDHQGMLYAMSIRYLGKEIEEETLRMIVVG